MQAYKSSCLRKATFTERNPVPMGVVIGPLIATRALERLLRERRAMLRNGCLPGHAHGPLKCDPGGFQASPRRLGHLRPDPIPWNEHHSMAHGRVHCFKRSSASSITWSEVAKLNRTWDEEPNPSPGTTARLI